ncbi:MAG TPA: energy transducer TonB [Steroidobacteraceae bacterium]|nr:energy transducer TonB [Steroidobacteraceae bacterium]
MSAYTQHNSQYFSRRAIVFIVAAGVQVMIVLAFSSGLANRVLNIVAPPIQTDIVQEVQKRDQPPPPPPPKMERPPVEVPPPEVAINVPVETNSTAITDVTNRPVRRAPPAPRPVHHAVIRVASLDMRRSGDPNDYYPPTSRRLEEQGTAIVRACVNSEGRLDGSPSIQHTSGSSRLDEAAVKYASHARYNPETEDGRPVPGCTAFRVKFELTD